MLTEHLITLAFLIGIISAVSLPLGTLTTLFWRPGERAIAWLMAFGAGALLSAVTIDLFAPAVQRGLFLEVAAGALIGSLFYLKLNNQLNAQGGFLRKTATTIQYFRNHQKKHRQQLNASLNRLSFFQALPAQERDQLLQHIEVIEYSANHPIYHHSDIHNAFYIIQKGRVNLRDPNHNLKTFIELDQNDAFGRMAFFTSLPNATLAQAQTDVTLWKIDRHAFNEWLAKTEVLPQVLMEFFQTDQEVRRYLKHRHRMTEKETEEHLRFIIDCIRQDQRLPHAREPRDTFDDALERLQHTRRFEPMDRNHESLNAMIAPKLKLRSLKAGQTIFGNHSESDRLYLLQSGKVERIDPKVKREKFQTLHPGDYFGVMAFVLGGEHATSTIAKTDVSFWVLEKFDFMQLLGQADPLHARLKSYLKTRNVHQYLVQEQKLPESQAQKWFDQSVKHLMPGELPSLNRLYPSTAPHTAAYTAIWLGIFLDGIPESLMIGSHLTQGEFISLSLIAGLFLSNYPEALSSSASMREQGIPFQKVLFAWSFLMVMTGIGAALVSILLSGGSPSAFALIGGIAAGAMLTVISETMLPEAYVKGGSIIGFVTLLGFLTALSFKFLEPGYI